MSEKKKLSELSEDELAKLTKKLQEKTPTEKKLESIIEKNNKEFDFFKEGAKGKIIFLGCYVNNYINKENEDIQLGYVRADFFLYKKNICAIIDFALGFSTYRIYVSSKKDNTDNLYSVIDELEELIEYNCSKVDYENEEEWTMFIKTNGDCDFITKYNEVTPEFDELLMDIFGKKGSPILYMYFDLKEINQTIAYKTTSCLSTDEKAYSVLRKEDDRCLSRDEFYEYLMSFFK